MDLKPPYLQKCWVLTSAPGRQGLKRIPALSSCFSLWVTHKSPQRLPHLTLHIWDSLLLCSLSVFLSVSLSCHSSIPRSPSCYFCSHWGNSPMCLNAISLFFQTSRWISEGLKMGFLRPLSSAWRGQACLEDAQDASKLDFVFIICIWMCISKGSSADLPCRASHLHSFRIRRLSLKPNSKCNQWGVFKT